jgi:hypothetical protein
MACPSAIIALADNAFFVMLSRQLAVFSVEQARQAMTWTAIQVNKQD